MQQPYEALLSKLQINLIEKVRRTAGPAGPAGDGETQVVSTKLLISLDWRRDRSVMFVVAVCVCVCGGGGGEEEASTHTKNVLSV